MPPMRRRDLLKSSVSALLTAALPITGPVALAQTLSANHPGIELIQLAAERSDDGLTLSYTLRLELSKEVEDALQKGVALVFEAQAELMRTRWYWSDLSRNQVSRRWRLAYQPLTRRWRLNFDGLTRTYGTLAEALGVMRRSTQWRIADTPPIGEERDHYVMFSFRLDTEELPRPMQIGLGGQNDWNLAVERRINISTAR